MYCIIQIKTETTYKAITGTQAFILAQFSASQTIATNGGPAMILPPSVEQYNTKYEFVTSGDYKNYMMISIATGTQHQLFLDDNLLNPPTGTVWGAVANSNPAMVASPVEIVSDAGGAHVLQHQDGQNKFGLYIYSRQKTSGECTIMYNAGSCINNLAQVMNISH